MTPRHRRFSHGLALIATLMLVVVFLILIGSLLDAMVKESSLTGVHGQSNRALQAAYAGIETMQYQLEENDAGAAPGVVPGTITQTYANDDGSTATFTVSVDTKRWQAALPYYLVHAQGTSGSITRSVDALIRKAPFSVYQLFTVSEKSNVGGRVYYATGENFEGPVYSGGPMSIDYTPGSNNPIFNNTVITASDPKYFPHKPAPGETAICGPSCSFSEVSAPKTLPTAKDNSAVENAALTGQPNPPSPPVPPGLPGLYVNGLPPKNPGGLLQSGLYISGNVDITSIGSVPSPSCSTPCGTETLKLNITGAGLVTVSVDYAANTTTITNGAGSVIGSYTGVPSGEPPAGTAGANGAVFVNGSATFEDQSSIHGKLTFAQPDALGESNPPMYLKGSLTYADKKNDELALWANDVILEDGNSGPIEVDGMLLTGYYGECLRVCRDGTFYNKFCTAALLCGGGSGQLTLFGSLIENVRGKRGTFDPTSGFSTIAQFDGRLSKSPPPFTPTTVEYDVIALCAEDGTTGNCRQ